VCNLEEIQQNSPEEIQQQMKDNIQWIKGAQENKSGWFTGENFICRCRRKNENCRSFNKAIKNGEIGPVVLGRDHHDVSEQIRRTERLPIFMTVRDLRQIWRFTM
jgi:urocanate hydratase